MAELSSHAVQNREAWTRMSVDFEAPGRRAWQSDSINWGIWNVPESEIGVLGDLSQWRGKDAIELGCGTGYVSAWLAKLGMRPVGIDVTPAQLANARHFQHEFGIDFPLIEGSAENVPLPEASFDLAISEYGASIWCDPERWIAEASRLLRPGGTLVFLRNGTVSILCSPAEGPATDRLVNDWRGISRMEWDGAVEFHLPTGDMIRLLRRNGFEVEDLIEVFPPPGTPDTRFEYITSEWSNRWPSEEIWRARKVR